VDSNLTTYQTSDTAWRYENQLARAKADIANMRNLLAVAEQRVKYLEDHPPLYAYFNWSA